MAIRESLTGETRRRQYRFGPFLLDLEAGFLRRDGDEVMLRPKAFEVLARLVVHHGKLVSKNELVQAVWPDAAVTDNSLAQCLSEVRRALGDDSQSMIRTVARRGYVFAAAVTTVLGEVHRETAAAGPAPYIQVARQPAVEASWRATAAVILLVIVMVSVGAYLWISRDTPLTLTFTQLTDFTDSAMAPAVSPDGRMIAFIRGNSAFRSPGQIWVKLMPAGEPVQLTELRGNKYGIAFSHDGSRIAFTVSGRSDGWQTWTVPALGGDEARPMLPNAAGLTWIDRDRILFSEIRSGMHMGIVTSREDRGAHREVYFPEHERAMAHYSSLSPDRRWVLIVEMNDVDLWGPCRLASFEGSAPSRQVGPDGACVSAAWSPDGRWMYFSVQIDGRYQLWRQRAPNGAPEQITAGPNDHVGVAVLPDGSLATSVGVSESAVWVRDNRGEYPITSAGKASPTVSQGLSSRPVFSHDGNYLYYLLRRDVLGSTTELWRYDIHTPRHEPVLTGFPIIEYDIADDDAEAVFTTQTEGQPPQTWLARLDRSTAPARIAALGDRAPHFGPGGEILFQLSDGRANYVGRMGKDGSARATLIPPAISTLQALSWDRKWLVVLAPVSIAPETSGPQFGRSQGDGMASFAIPVGGGSPQRLCVGFCLTQWAQDGRHVYITLGPSAGSEPGRTVEIPLEPGQTIPNLPRDGFRLDDLDRVPGAHLVEGGSGTGELRLRGFSPSSDPGVIAYVKTNVHHNLFQIHLH
jgi:DNA-binding winged helix-turn-helix (wHTH) protein/Tol biopolymer transport system component